MTSHTEHDDIYEQLMSISQEALVRGSYETAYHTLCAAMHYATHSGDEHRLSLVEQAAKAQRDWIDTKDPKHRMSTQSAHERQGTSMYEMLARQAAAQALVVQHQHRREQTQPLPWPDNARSYQRDERNTRF
jgi:hypothetical protein